MYKRILIAVKSRDQLATRAARAGAELARQLHADVALVHVVDARLSATVEPGLSPESIADSLHQEGDALLHSTAQTLFPSQSPELLLREDVPAHGILAAADAWHADLIVLGAHGRGRVAHLLLGSTSDAVIHGSHCPVLAVHDSPGPDSAPTPGA